MGDWCLMSLDNIERGEVEGVEKEDVACSGCWGCRGDAGRRCRRRGRWRGRWIGEIRMLGRGGQSTYSYSSVSVHHQNAPFGFGPVSIVCNSFIVEMS